MGTEFEVVAADSIERLPSERRHRMVLACGGCGCCCCCCCCCVHSAGGLLASAVTSLALVTAARPAPTAALASGFLLRCKTCGTGVPIDPAQAGQTIVCAKCGNQGMVPAPAVPTAVAVPTPAPDPRSRRVGVGAYWQVFALLAIVMLLVGSQETEVLWILALGLPVVQLFAVPGALVLVGILPSSIVPSKRDAFGAIGKIALAVFAGSAIGLALMIPLGVGAAALL